ncbi:MAG: right-handed parallel beta-helix repeat-containing protein [Desulfobulbaceae bacterium]|nr:right-handed parallel beta-helix repeat-containing protein [Desulfobulbaceae bacterium]
MLPYKYIVLLVNYFIVSLVVFSRVWFVSSCSAANLHVPEDFEYIMEAMEDAEFGDTIIIGPGVYKERLILKEGVNMVSSAEDGGNELQPGPGHKKVLTRTLRTIIDGSDIDEPGYLFSFPYDTPAPMRVDGFTFRNMPKYNSGVKLFIMEVRGCSPKVVNNIFYGNQSWGAILATGLGVGMGPAMEAVARPLIQNNVIYDNYGPGIANGANSAAVIKFNEIFQNTFPGSGNKDPEAPSIGMRSYARPVIINNDCYNCGASVGGLNFEDYKEDLVIRNNHFYNGRRAGIGLRIIDGTDTQIKVIIENNQISGNMKAGIMHAKVDDITFRYNSIYNNRKAGIILTNVDKAVITDNNVRGNLTAGVRLIDVPRVMMRGNYIYRNITAGIDVIGSVR